MAMIIIDATSFVDPLATVVLADGLADTVTVGEGDDHKFRDFTVPLTTSTRR
jgi:hypothetical protein